MYETLNLVKFDFSKQEIFWHSIMYSLIAFFTPFFLGHPQWLVGTIINAVLILAALNLKTYETLPIILLPSLGVLSAGLIFGEFTMLLVYLIPFIWIGNSLIVYFMKVFHIKRKYNYAMSLVLSSLIKSGFLFLSAVALFYLGVVPVMFLTVMGVLQLGTAISGGIVAYAFSEVNQRLIR